MRNAYALGIVLHIGSSQSIGVVGDSILFYGEIKTVNDAWIARC